MSHNLIPSLSQALQLFRFYAFIAVCGAALVIVGAAAIKMPWILIVAVGAFYVGRFEKEIRRALRDFWDRHFDGHGVGAKN